MSVPGYTKVNLKQDVKDSAQDFGFAPNLEARFATGALELQQSGLSYQRLAPDFRMPFGHRQKQQEELYVVVSGGGRMKLDDEIVEIGQWDAIRVPPDVMRSFEAGPDGAEILAVGAPNTGPNSNDDVEMTPGWWSD
jgi:mannose-6-phosphate isomerase-like protein (cupin superfamily)